MLTRPLYTVNCNHHHNADFNNACCGQANDRKYFTNPRHVELLPLVILERRKHARVALLVVFVSAASRNRQYWHMCSHCGYGTSWDEWKDIHYRQARLVVVTTYRKATLERKPTINMNGPKDIGNIMLQAYSLVLWSTMLPCVSPVVCDATTIKSIQINTHINAMNGTVAGLWVFIAHFRGK